MGRVPRREVGTVPHMKILKTAALAGVAKKLYGESRKPENQRRIKAAIEQAKARGSRKKGH